MKELIGQTLGKYKIEARIGQGGMATVFRAHQVHLNRYVAVKVLPPQYAEGPGFAERFKREAQAIAQLEHPHILPVYDYGQQGPYTYLVMRYVEHSRTLAHAMLQSLTLRQGVEYLKQVASALDYAHERGIIHRDIKPGNILLNENWVFLADFGLARMVESATKLTRTGTGMGTPAYMSPEQGAGQTVDKYTDIYAVGVIAFQMFTGQIPHDADAPHAIIYKRNHEPPPLLRESNPNIPIQVEKTVRMALSPKPDQRFQTSSAFIRALDHAITEERASNVMTTVVAMPPANPQQPEATPSMYNEATATFPSQAGFIPTATTPPQPQTQRPKFCGNCGVSLPDNIAFCNNCGTAVTSVSQSQATSPQKRPPWLWIGIGLGTTAAICVVLGSLSLGSWLGQASPTPTSPPVISQLNTATATHTATSTPSETATQTPTETVIIAEDTAIPIPTATATNTATPPPPATNTPTPEPFDEVDDLFGPVLNDNENEVFGDGFRRDTINTDRWLTFEGDGQIELQDGSVFLRSQGKTFPLLIPHENPFPDEGNFTISIEMQHPAITERGTGFYLGKTALSIENITDSDIISAGRLIEVWQDSQQWRVTVGPSNEVVHTLNAPNRVPHLITINYINQIYQILVDEEEVFRTQPTNNRPVIFWLGNPTQLETERAWSDLEIDDFSIRRLADEETLAPPTPTPLPPVQGNIVFVTDTYGASEIGLLQLNNGGSKQLTFNHLFDWGPSVSLDNEQIAYVSDFSGNPEIYIMPITGGAATQLTFNEVSDDHPSWSATDSIVFTSNRESNWDIFIMKEVKSNGAVENLTNHPARDTYPAVSPDGQTIAFISDRDGAPGLYLMDIDGSNVRTFITAIPNIWAPAWSPDSTKLLFVSVENEATFQGSIYISNRDGSGLRRFISSAGGEAGYPTWSPYNDYIAFTRQPSQEETGRIYRVTLDGDVIEELFAIPGASVWSPAWGK